MGEGERVVKRLCQFAYQLVTGKGRLTFGTVCFHCFLLSAQFNDLPFGMKQSLSVFLLAVTLTETAHFKTSSFLFPAAVFIAFKQGY